VVRCSVDAAGRGRPRVLADVARGVGAAMRGARTVGGGGVADGRRSADGAAAGPACGVFLAELRREGHGGGLHGDMWATRAGDERQAGAGAEWGGDDPAAAAGVGWAPSGWDDEPPTPSGLSSLPPLPEVPTAAPPAFSAPVAGVESAPLSPRDPRLDEGAGPGPGPRPGRATGVAVTLPAPAGRVEVHGFLVHDPMGAPIRSTSARRAVLQAILVELMGPAAGRGRLVRVPRSGPPSASLTADDGGGSSPSRAATSRAERAEMTEGGSLRGSRARPMVTAPTSP